MLEENGQYIPAKRIRRCKGTLKHLAWAGNGRGQHIGCEVETGIGGTAEEIRSGRLVQCVGLKESRHCRKTGIWEPVKPGKSTTERSSSPDTSCFCNQLYFDMEIPHMGHFVINLGKREVLTQLFHLIFTLKISTFCLLCTGLWA